MMKKETEQLILDLKTNNEDYEFYPTTKEMVECIHRHINANWEREHNISEVLDIGCGTENFRKYINELYAEREEWKRKNERKPNGEYDYGISNATNFRISDRNYYVMEKSKILLQRLNKNTIVLGTDFWQQTLLDKKVDMIFCNPPYSEYREFTKRILFEGNCKYIYLVIPKRWKEDKEIQKSLDKIAPATAKVIGSFDFLNAERNARAEVDIVFIDKSYTKKNLAFDEWFDETFKMLDKEEKDEYSIERDKEASIKNEIVGGANKGEILLNLYEAEQRKLYEHFKAISSLDVDILESIGVQKTAVKESLKSKIKGLKILYWKIVFDNLDEITSRLTSDTREDMFNRFKELQSVDFTAENIYSLLLWVIKNANNYYTDQMIKFFKDLSSAENCKPYKSNDRIGTDNWRFAEENSHYTLDYRIVCSRFSFSYYGHWEPKIERYKAERVVEDICAIANNLNFEIGLKEIPKCFGDKATILLKNSEVFCEYRTFKNGNTHFKFNKEFMKALNVEVSRQLGWINKPEDISKEFDKEMSEGAEKYFKQNLQYSLTSNNIKLLGVANR